MNRRSFLTDIIKLAVAPMVLPAALTYGRQWKAAQDKLILNPDYTSMRWNGEIILYDWVFLAELPGAYNCINIGPPPNVGEALLTIK